MTVIDYNPNATHDPKPPNQVPPGDLTDAIGKHEESDFDDDDSEEEEFGDDADDEE